MKSVRLVFEFTVMLAIILLISFVPADAEAQTKNWRVFTGAWSYHPLSKGKTKTLHVQGFYYEKLYSEKYQQWYYDWVYKDYVLESKPVSLNETHNLLAVQYGKYFIGYFKNSYHDDSALVGYNVYHRSYEYFDVDLYVGASYGYRDCFTKFETTYSEYLEKSKKVCPLAVPMITLTANDLVQPYVALFGAAIATGISWKF